MDAEHTTFDRVGGERNRTTSRSDERDRRHDDKRSEIDDVTWSRSLASAIAAPSQVVSRTAPELNSEASTSWRDGDADLTKRGKGQAQKVSQGRHEKPDLNNMTLELDGGRLGRITIKIQETSRGLSLAIALQKPGTTSVVVSTLPELLGALGGLGVKVAEVKINEPDGTGTSIALLGTGQLEPRRTSYRGGLNIIG